MCVEKNVGTFIRSTMVQIKQSWQLDYDILYVQYKCKKYLVV